MIISVNFTACCPWGLAGRSVRDALKLEHDVSWTLLFDHLCELAEKYASAVRKGDSKNIAKHALRLKMAASYLTDLEWEWRIFGIEATYELCGPHAALVDGARTFAAVVNEETNDDRALLRAAARLKGAK